MPDARAVEGARSAENGIARPKDRGSYRRAVEGRFRARRRRPGATGAFPAPAGAPWSSFRQAREASAGGGPTGQPRRPRPARSSASAAATPNIVSGAGSGTGAASTKAAARIVTFVDCSNSVEVLVAV